MAVPGEGAGKTVLVTGASAGIGRELARVFASHAFDLVLVARTASKLEELASELRERCGVQVTPLPTDLLEPGAPQALFEELRKRGIAIEVLVNDAGTLESGSMMEMPPERLLDMVNLNVAALTLMTRLFVEPMIEGGGGRVLNVGSIVGFQPAPSMAVYGATKAYILSLSEALSEELRDTGVSVTALCPGFTTTQMADKIKGVEALKERAPAAMMMAPADVAREGYEACMAGEAIRVPGLPNQIALRILGIQPRWLLRTLGGFIARRTS
jgi:short-subunit dehydrogenase